MTPIEPTSPLTVILQAQEWNQVVFWLGKQPYENVAPLIAKISEQAQAAAAQTPQSLANGVDHHVRD
jgi:hypothetical protein